MIRLDLRTNAAARARALTLIMASLPEDGRAVCYATLGLAGGEDAGPLVQDLIDDGKITLVAANDMLLYRRAV